MMIKNTVFFKHLSALSKLIHKMFFYEYEYSKQIKK